MGLGWLLLNRSHPNGYILFITKNGQIVRLLYPLIERDQKNRSKRIKNTIGKYKLTIGFDDTKALVHSLLKKIPIRHQNKQELKGGFSWLKLSIGILRSFDPEDPVRYDFALFGLGAVERFWL